MSALYEQPTAREAVHTVVGYMKSSLENGVGVGQAMIGLPDGAVARYVINPNVMDDWRTKNQLAAKMVRYLFEKQGKWLIFATDAWFAKVPPTFDQSKLPKDFSDLPDDLRFQALLISCNAIGEEGFFVMVPYTRDEENHITWEPIIWESATSSIGRFIFDLRTRRLNDALKQAYGADREGRRKARVQ